MGIIINKNKCTGCKQCVNICPGNIIRTDEAGKAYLKRPSDCWNCMSCVKECPSEAITLILPPEMGGKGGILSVKRKENITEWTINKADGSKVVLVTNTEEANNY